MPHTFAREGEDLRDPHGGTSETSEPSGLSTRVKLAGAAVAAFLLFRAFR